MKTARQRAEELWDFLPAHTSIDLYYKNPFQHQGKGKEAWLRDVELSFKEHARDQRHLCTDAVRSSAILGIPAVESNVFNTPAPGEV